MKLNRIVLCLVLMLLFTVSSVFAASATTSTGSKKLDLSRWHNVGNIWLRVSNYGFFGSGNDVVPQYPSLEYPGGSGIDYLYQGALWFGAKKYRRDDAGNKLYWKANNPTSDSSQTIPASSPYWNAGKKAVIDTLVTVGFDGDADLYEFLPAYNPLVVGNAALQDQYNMYNIFDQMSTASTRTQKRGLDDDGDGIIDEDGAGYTFPFRRAIELPTQFASFGGQYIANTNNFNIINEANNVEIWFPLGFMDLSDTSFSSYAFSQPHDDDMDGQLDEDGAPVSEQDFISYYYDYCPFKTTGDRDLGGSRSSNDHYPLNVRIRQMSYQWSYEYIKNLVYVEFNITNMNIAFQDTLFDCAMGIYMDADTGPQSYGSTKANDDVSGYVRGDGYEFAYTRDFDGDGGLTTGLVGARVCSPSPEDLTFDCWYWKVGDGPEDSKPRGLTPSFLPRKTANEKYWLLTGRNPQPTKITALRPPLTADPHFEQDVANDTRFLFSFYGDMLGSTAPTIRSWNLAPGRTMKIVVALFPGDNIEDLKRTARWAKEIYGKSQDLTTVILPDTFPHYNPPEPPEIPKLFAELQDNGNRIDLFWDNRSEFSYDLKTVSAAIIGWQNTNSALDSYAASPAVINNNALVNPITADRLRHDFQGYTVWGRSGSGSQEDWEMMERWDKIETAQDQADYNVNYGVTYNGQNLFINFGGYLGIEKGLPNISTATVADTSYYKLNELYMYRNIVSGEEVTGLPIYDSAVDWSAALQAQADAMVENPNMLTDEDKVLQARLFRNPAIRQEVYDALVDSKVIPLAGHGGQVAIPSADNGNSYDDLNELRQKRLARRYYTASIANPPKGIEYYLAVTAYDRGIPSNDLNFLETGRDADANMKVFFPGAIAGSNMKDIYVVPNPYIGRSKFDGRRENDKKGDKSRRLWFVNIPENCVIRIYTLAGDLVDQIDHNGAYNEDIINVSKAALVGISGSAMQSWDLLSKNDQIIAPGVYLYSVENKADSKVKVGKFVIIK